MDYELLKEDDSSYHLKDPRGREIRVAKQAISDALHERIRSYARGGLVEDTSAEAPVPKEERPFEPQNFVESVEYGLGKLAGPFVQPFTGQANAEGMAEYERNLGNRIASNRLPDSQSVSATPSNLVATTGLPPQSAIPQASPTVPIGGEVTTGTAPGGDQTPLLPPSPQGAAGAAGPGYDTAFGQMSQAARVQSDAQKAYYDTVKLEQDAANQRMADIDMQMQTSMKGMEDSQNELMNAAMTQKIDPNRLWASAGMGSKVTAAIGLILGGLGSGLTGGPNQALQTLNRLVDQDIDAQKTELGKKQTLLSMNLQKYRDMNTAMSATKAQIASVLQGRIASAAALLGGQQAKAAELQANAAINMERGKLNQQVVQAQTARAISEYVGRTGDISYAGYLPAEQAKDLRERAVPGLGLATTKEGAAKANELVAATKSGVDMLNQLKAFGDKKGSSISMKDRQDAETLALMIRGAIREGVLGPGTVNEGERKILETLVRNPTDVFGMSTNAKTSIDRIIKSMEMKRNDSLKQYGLRAPKTLDFGAPVK